MPTTPSVRAAPALQPDAVPAAVPEIPEIADPQSVSTADAHDLSVTLFRRLHALEEGTAEYSYVRNTLVELNLSMVKYAATRVRHCSAPWEDVIQVGTIGLIKAINRFDPERGFEFMSFALPTIVGEIKRYFRDTTWAVRVPRRLQELRIDLAKANDALEQELGHAPSAQELAERLGITAEEVCEGRVAANGFTSLSLDLPVTEEDDAPGTLARSLGTEETRFETVEDLESLKPLLRELTERDRTILALRFGEELTQAEIGERLGMSQMHVSRLLGRILGRLREGLLAEEPEEPQADPA
ncbi:SigB/SigF/SigG family RNA polymerase sigma factor [Streptomyces avidinii]|uniref:RNA polymerase sigma-B factor n=1 Tax=Streptomyces avidinii TaxID=1895 RepID=A0ABS4L795_STRAV|nr:SigB/SigF/SigG family RNA polymerase sigma factor [Streptomyces avidinii]MBP2037959.1 RNA polymerase sigma-B factor [Streptomyces avidinii]GGZ07345.1 RNA polymerase sigma factor [Streptomyces avidinii]